MTDLDMDVMMDAARRMATEDRSAVDTAHRMDAAKDESPWLPYSPETVAEKLRRPVEEVRARFGDTVLVQFGIGEVKLRRAAQDPAQVRAEVTDILARGRRHG